MTFRQRMIRIVFMFLAGILVLLPFYPAEAAGQKYINVTVNGREISFDVRPYVDSQNRTIIPLRFVSEELAYNCNWNAAAREVSVTGEGNTIRLWAGKKDAEVNGKTVAMDTVAVVTDGRAMVPLRFILENMGTSVSYDPATNTANITSGGTGSGGSETPVTGTITGKVVLAAVDDLNVRSGPGTAYPVLQQVNKGDILLVTAQTGDWYQVSIEGGNKGWLASWLVTLRSVGDTASRGDDEREDEDTNTDTNTDSGTDNNPAEVPADTGISSKTIVIDPGHASLQSGGWSDPGAVGPNKVYEKDVVLAIALKVKSKLEDLGANVIMTRTGDTTLTLAGRAAIANQNQADAFVSIHANANTNSSISGTSTYYYGGVAGQSATRKNLASLVQEELVRSLDRKNLGVLTANFAVLRETLVPSILVETAFISNPGEEKLLVNASFQEKAAQGIVNGLERYFQ